MNQAASTLYGPHTLSAYIQQFKNLAFSLANGTRPPKTRPLSPPDLSSRLISLVPRPFPDATPEDKTFGDTKQDVVVPPKGHFSKGDKATATFYSANPRNDLLTEGTFASVEMLEEEKGEVWVPVYDDDDVSLVFRWTKEGGGSFATIEWEIPGGVVAGVYRLRHFGAYFELLRGTQYFTGASSSFRVQ